MSFLFWLKSMKQSSTVGAVCSMHTALCPSAARWLCRSAGAVPGASVTWNASPNEKADAAPVYPARSAMSLCMSAERTA